EYTRRPEPPSGPPRSTHRCDRALRQGSERRENGESGAVPAAWDPAAAGRALLAARRAGSVADLSLVRAPARPAAVLRPTAASGDAPPSRPDEPCAERPGPCRSRPPTARPFRIQCSVHTPQR